MTNDNFNLSQLDESLNLTDINDFKNIFNQVGGSNSNSIDPELSNSESNMSENNKANELDDSKTNSLNNIDSLNIDEIDQPVGDVNDNIFEETNNSNSNLNDIEIDGELEQNNTVNKVVIQEDEDIAENKIISNDNEQKQDIINEFTKLLPEKDRTKKHELKKIRKSVKFFEQLKYECSEIDNGEIKKYNFKGNYYKKNFNEYLNGDFSSKYLIPIIQQKRNIYKTIDEDSIDIDNYDELSDSIVNKKENLEEIDKMIKIRDKYKKSEFRLNYSYKNEINELYPLIDYETNISKENTIEFILDKDTIVFGNNTICFNKKEFSKSRNYIQHSLGSTNFYGNDKIVSGNKISVTGFVREPIQKLNILKLNQCNLIDLVNNKFGYNDLFNNIDVYKSELIEPTYNIGDLIKIINITDLTEDAGYIKEINDNIINIQPISEPNESVRGVIDIDISDKNIVIYNIQNTSRDALSYCEHIYKKFEFEEYDEKINLETYKTLLDLILPSTYEIINNLLDTQYFNSVESIDEILNYLKYYDLTFNDITNDNFKKLNSILYKNIKRNIDQSIKNDSQFEILKRKSTVVPLKDFQFISNYSLKEYDGIYGPYPYFRTNIDSLEQRLTWLNSREDKGELYFSNIVKKIHQKIKQDPSKIVSDLQDKLSKLYVKETELENLIRLEKERIIANKNVCVDNFISKEYHNLDQLKNDNNKIIQIDKDKIIYGKPMEVPIGSFALLHNSNGSKRLFKRIELPNKSHIWNLQDGINIDHIVLTNKDFCDQQFKSINELEISIKNINICKFSELTNSCLTKELYEHISNLDIIINQKKDVQIHFDEINTIYDYDLLLNKKIEMYEKLLGLKNEQLKKQFLIKEQELIDEAKLEIDPQYEALYLKIDYFLQKISTMTDYKKYDLLNYLLKKYNRTPNKDENPENIYCKYGNKVLCCNHNTYFIDIFVNNKDPETKRDELIEKYGIENQGKFWCINCGIDLFNSEFETRESFKQNGALNITSEVLEPDELDEKEKDKSVLLLETLKNQLNYADTLDSKTLNIYQILEIILDIMGIKLNTDDEIQIIKYSTNLCKSDIKNKTSWSQSYKGKPKHIDKNYLNYVNIYTIIYTLSYLFITLQTSIPKYTIKKPHKKCKASLDGYPLDLNETNTSGLTYFECILTELSLSDSIWKCLKKQNIVKSFMGVINKIILDDFILNKYDLKRTYISREKIDNEIKVENNWLEFKPSLTNFEINNPQFNSLNISTKPKNINEITNYYSLKTISEIDNIVNQSDVENYVFLPSLLSQSCCLSNLDNEFNNLTYFFDKNKQLQQIYNKNLELEVLHKGIETYSNLYINNDLTELLPSFSKIILELDEDIDPHLGDTSEDKIDRQNIIRDLFINYVSRDENIDLAGKKRIYDEDICTLTSNTKDVIKNKIYRKEDYDNLLLDIFKHTLVTQPNIIINLPVDNFKEIIDKNYYLQNDDYINKFSVLLQEASTKKKIDECWDDFNEEINILIQTINELFIDIDPKFINIQDILTNLANLNEIKEENDSLYSKEKSDTIFINNKIILLKKYIFTYFNNSISKIKHNKDTEIVDIPDNWKLDPSYTTNLTNHILKENELIKPFIIRKNSNEIYNKIINIIQKSIKDIKHIFGLNHISNSIDIVNYSKITNENITLILKYIFLLTLKNILSVDYISEIPIIKANTFDKSIEIDIDGEAGINVSLDEQIELEPEEIVSQNKNEIYELVYIILKRIEEDRLYLDKFTESKIKENIEKNSDIEKESSLEFIRDLEKESRQSLKVLLSLGIETWKNLSSKEDKHLFFGEPEEAVQEDTEEIQPTDSEMNAINHDRAVEQFGDGYSEDQMEQLLAGEGADNAFVPDDDGDFMGDDEYWDGEI